MDPEKAQNQIIDAIKLQRDNLEKANQLAEFDPSVNFKNQLNQNVELYPMLINAYGFENLRSVMTLPNLMIDNETHQHYPILTTYYIMLLIGIVFYFSNKKNPRTNIATFKRILFQILEENAITGIIYIITKNDLENLKQARMGHEERYTVMTLSDYNENNIVNSVYIIDNVSRKVFQSVVMLDSFSFDTLNKLLAPSFPMSDIRTDFIRNKSIYSISNTGVINYLNMLYSTPSTKLKLKSTAGLPVAGKTSVTNPMQISKKFSRRKKTKGGKRKRLTRKIKRTRKTRTKKRAKTQKHRNK